MENAKALTQIIGVRSETSKQTPIARRALQRGGDGACMRNLSFADEADACRRQAAKFAGRPEAQFLLRIAQSFEEMETASFLRIDRDSSNELRPTGGV